MPDSSRIPTLSPRQVFWLWLPLAATWCLMAVEGPIVNLFVARMPEATTNLAALGVALAICMILESPMFMILSTSVALVENWRDYRRLARFTVIIAAILSLLLALTFSPYVFSLISKTVLDVPPEVAASARIAGLLCTPIPFAVAYRRFYQGILIRNKLSRLVAAGTVIRFVSMAISSALLFSFDLLPGASSAALSLSIGMIMEAVFAREFTRPILRRMKAAAPEHEVISYPAIFRFWLPLALNSMIFMAIQPMLTFFLSHSNSPVKSLAVFPVVHGCVFLFVAQAIALQEVVLSQLGTGNNVRDALRTFMFRLAGVLGILMGIVFFTPLDKSLFIGILGLPPDLAEFARSAAHILVLLPFFTLIGVWFRAHLMHARNTTPITTATIVEVAVAGLFMWNFRNAFGLPGVMLAAMALVAGRIGATAWLQRPYNRIKSVPAWP